MTEEDPNLDEREAGVREMRRWLGFSRRMLHFWPTLLISLVLAAVAAGVFLFLMKPAYRSETVLLYSQGVSSTDPSDPSTSPRNATARLKELLLSRRELSRIVSQFGLYPKVREAYGADDAVDELKRHLEFRAPGGDTFSISFQGGSPSEAQSVTAALAKMVIEGDAKLRKSQTEFAQSFLATEKSNRAATLKEAEQQLAAFMADHQRFALDSTPLAAGAAIRATLPGMAPVSSAAPQQRWVQAPAVSVPGARSGGAAAAGPVAAAPSEDAAERARATAAVAAARAHLAEQKARFTEAHPDVRAAQGSLDRAVARLEAFGPEVRQPVAAPAPPPPRPRTETRVAAPAVAPAASAPSARATPESPDDVVKLETEWLKLTRAVTAARQRLDQVEAALFKADIQANSERTGSGVQISVIDPAYLPQRPLGLSRTMIVIACAVAGMVFGLIAVALRAAFDDRVLAPSDLGRRTALLVQVPRLEWRGRIHGTG